MLRLLDEDRRACPQHHDSETRLEGIVDMRTADLLALHGSMIVVLSCLLPLCCGETCGAVDMSGWLTR